MLRIIVPGRELFNEETSEIFSEDEVVLELEHSLVSLSKWESEFEKPFLGKEEKSPEEVFGYIKAMIVTPDFPPEVFSRLSQDNLDDINAYIEKAHTATTFREEQNRPGRHEIITSELIYFWMVTFQIPFETETWHLNRLLTLVRVCNVKNQKQKPMSRSEIASRNAKLNAERRAKYGTSG